ncbi:unnamed protein product [Chilo suppressalis]|uniref:Carboxypeptidase activation peptide domain-containing protein n=1 Tax=Chilo suppressalis TaxID=168631 RepID=A0ABN8AXR5_CHISP|nr:unnamed protein product [Chilo suppressalis]
MNALKSIFLFFVLFSFVCAKHEQYDGHSLYEVKTDNMVQAHFFKQMERVLLLDVWNNPTIDRPGQVLVAKDQREYFENKLSAAGIRYKVTVENIKRSVFRRGVRAPRLFYTGTCRTNAGVRAPLRRLLDNYNTNFAELDIFGFSKLKFNKMVPKVWRHGLNRLRLTVLVCKSGSLSNVREEAVHEVGLEPGELTLHINGDLAPV